MDKKAIYPGSFDPFTLGHLDIVKRALKIFDHIYIAVGENKNKTTLFSTEERKEQISEIFKNNPKITVTSFNELLVNFAKKINVFTVIRGLRAVSDFEFEFQMALTNRVIEPEFESIFFMTSEKYSFLSSSIVKEIASKSDTELSQFLTPDVEKALRKKLKCI
ncbi:MAG TPA: pantetheine-phosphate adenylyltransferase [bacterium]|jgi:pantetheine-phosphate adenylyltransferase|nr:pantetheine-phosphate adenylyltransferase [bacterium]MDX9804866.1 pantetheine-phosphate adenylyltransferase [bacterium]HNW15350.1 pantetheine-phosphate adenylyltransferase [bacterium]HNZ54144.1 pantetheine-phosphate adenylyltransferase [bacterium]HOB72665.1 pantetheine-phosphate adenylyltransferase [bacterium]